MTRSVYVTLALCLGVLIGWLLHPVAGAPEPACVSICPETPIVFTDCHDVRRITLPVGWEMAEP